MSLESEAIQSAFEYYNQHSNVRTAATEFGCVLFENRADGALFNSSIIAGPAGGRQIDLYPIGIGFDVLKSYADGAESERLYVGDYHTHASGSAYPTELPSDADLFRWGVLCDLCPLWNLWKSLQKSPPFKSLQQLESIPLAQRFQIVQPARFGDLIVMRPVADREKFTTLGKQESALEPLARNYRQFLRSIGNGGSIRDDRETYRRRMQGFVQSINALLGHRALMEYRFNPAALEEAP